MDFERIWDAWPDAGTFSGVFSVRDAKGPIFERCGGFRNKGEALPNGIGTAFGIASGTKLFTALAICRLVDAGRLSLDDRLWDILSYDLGQMDRRVTVRHLLTHTSGIGDYLDEEDPDAYEKEREMCNKYPVYLWERLEYYLQMNTPLPPKFAPGARFGYSNAGFIMLGLIIEAASGMPYQRYVEEAIIAPLGLSHTGFYRMDALPANTAYGYIRDAQGAWRTNIYSLPVIGGSDGGLFTCAADLDTLWRAIFGGRVLSGGMLDAFLRPQVPRGEGKSYGLGIYRIDLGERTAFYAVGGDFGVDFYTAYFPARDLVVSALGNVEANTLPLDSLFSALL